MRSGDTQRIAEAIDAIHLQYGDAVGGCVRDRFPGLTSDELASVWMCALESVVRMARKNRVGNRGSLYVLLITIAYRKAVDALRHKQRDLPHVSLEGVLEFLASPTVEHPLATEELCDRVREAIGRLPDRQRAVWTAYADLGYDPRPGELLKLVAERLDEPLTAHAVQRALQEGRRKLRFVLWKTFAQCFDGVAETYRERFEEWFKQDDRMAEE